MVPPKLKIVGLSDSDRSAPGICKGVDLIERRHFDRIGRKMCHCCLLEGIAQYHRIRQFNLDGRSYLVVCDSVHRRTSYDEHGKPDAYGILTEVFSADNMKTAKIFEIDRARLDRSDLTKGQRQLHDGERDAIAGRLLANEGGLLTLCEVERKVGARWEREGYYLGDEERPRTQPGSVFVSAAP